MDAEGDLSAGGDESFRVAVPCDHLPLKDEGAQDVQTASAWVVVPKDTDLSWRTSGHPRKQPIPRAQQVPYPYPK